MKYLQVIKPGSRFIMSIYDTPFNTGQKKG